MRIKAVFAALVFSIAFPSCGIDPLDNVDLFMGTEAGHGDLTPGACVPFGLVNVCPDSKPYGGAGYDFSTAETSFISTVRIPGMKKGEGSGGILGLKPGYYSDTLYLVKGSEKAYPGYYSGKFSDGTSFELTATKTVAIEKFSLGPDKRLFFTTLSQFPDRGIASVIEQKDEKTLYGVERAATSRAVGKYLLCFVLSADKPFKVVSGDQTYKGLQFEDKDVEIRISISPVDCDYAMEALDSLSSKDFEVIRKDAENAWREKLGRFKVYGGTKEQKILFYTSLYNIYHSPADVTTEDGYYYGTDGDYHKAEGYRYYSGWNMYDAFRTKFPLLSITDPKEASDMARSLCDLYRNGKKDWATMNESAPSVRSERAVVTILDYFEKKLVPLDEIAGAYAAMSLDMKTPKLRRKADERLAGAYDLWAMARIAGYLGHEEDSIMWAGVADSIFSVSWYGGLKGWDENNISNGDSEDLGRGCFAHAHWAAPVFLSDEDKNLDMFFSSYMYDVGNPDNFSAPFLYDDFEKRSEIIRKYIVGEKTIHEYRGGERFAFPALGRAITDATDGFAEGISELDGTLSAWYLFAQMGFYPTVPGVPEYSLFTPYFRKVEMNLDDRKIVIETRGRGSYEKGRPVGSVHVNGVKLSDTRIEHDFFLEGGTIEYKY